MGDSMFSQTSAMAIPNASDTSQPINISYQRNNSSVFQNPRMRRESIAHSQGMGGISWGSVTIGSWLKEEVMLLSNYHNQNNNNLNGSNSHLQQQNQNGLRNFLSGTGHHNINISNNAANNASFLGTSSGTGMSPSFGNSAYLANLEANYCKDYSCCGQLLPTLHDLLRHYEETHIQPSPPLETPRARPINNPMDTVSTNEVFLAPTGAESMEMGGSGGNTSLNNQQSLQNINSGILGQNSTGSSFGFGSGSSTQRNRSIFGQQQQQHNRVIQQQRQQQQVQQQTQQQQQQAHQAQQQAQQQNSQSQRHRSQAVASRDEMDIDDSPQQHFAMDEDEDDEMCIDDPARHLYVNEHGEYRPFKCPVIGCEKTYKNQNGLKYHRLHGHQNQTLLENDDGTFSILDPESNAPYPDGVGMEKDKPYRCEVCGKRYKNLNGLKYHRGHSTH